MIDMREIRAIGKKPKRPCQPPRHDPTPDQIAAECAWIQETWSPAEKLRRATPLRTVDMATVHRIVDGGG